MSPNRAGPVASDEVRRPRSLLIPLAVVAMLLVVSADPSSAALVTITATGDATVGTPFSPPDTTLRDLGISTRLSDDRRLWVFGDTFESGAARQSAVHSNTGALSERAAPGVVHDAKDDNGHRHPIVPLDASESAFNNGQRFRPVAPTRVHDSRDTPGSRLGPGESRDVSFPVPVDITGPRSAVFNLTAINTTATFTDLEVSEPTAPAAPSTSSLNLTGYETAANLVTGSLGSPASNPFAPQTVVRIRNAASSVEVIVDLVGFVTRSTGDQAFESTGPTRVFDSANCGPQQNLEARASITVKVRGASCLAAGAVPADATAVVVNLTADGPGSPSATHVTAWPSDQPMPATSNVNLGARDTRANMAVIPLSATGDIELFNSGGSFRVIVDVLGYLSASSASEQLVVGVGGRREEFVPVTPSRLCDSRDPTSPCAGGWGPRESRPVSLPALDVPAGASSVALNITIVGPTAATHLTAWSGGPMPVASNINAPPASIRAAMVITPVTADGTIQIFNNAGSADVIVDLLGFFAEPSAIVGTCGPGVPRMVIWPTSVVAVPGAAPPATDRVAIYYVRWVVCAAWTFLAQDVGVATMDYTAGQSLTDPMLAQRHLLHASLDGTVPPGSYVTAGVAQDGFVHLYGCHDDSPDNVCFLRRAPVGADLGDPSSYEYYSKAGSVVTWQSSYQSQTPIAFDPSGPVPSTQFPASDFSVVWVPAIGGGAGSFVMMYEPRWDSGNKPVIVRTADHPWGPWSEPVTKTGGGQPSVPGCDVTSLEVICRAFHIDPDQSDGSRLWFSYYSMAEHELKHSTLPIHTNEP